MDYVITAGGVSSGLSLGSDASLYVEGGGTAVDTTADGSNIQNRDLFGCRPFAWTENSIG